ncbi:hypothetical protein PAPHI01_0151 [Pancytospora philotis]|nr:hypothetical protein PAPHI01_0151 [Pancytospora philotis]
MPRKGWAKAHAYFCSRFSVNVSVEEFTRRAKKAVVSDTGRPCTVRQFQDRATKRVKTVTELLEESSLADARLYAKMLEKIQIHIRTASKTSVEAAERTRKVPSSRVDTNVLTALNRAVGQHVKENPPSTMEHIARILQAVQAVYQAETERAPRASPWAANITAKITRQREARDVLMKAQRGEELEDDERRTARKAMREQGLALSKPHDVGEAVATLDNLIRAHEKRLEMNVKRKEFHKQNMQFELNRKRFYRGLSGDQGMTHTVPAEEVKAFWSTMWNKPETETESTGLNRWLLSFDAGPEAPAVFPTRAEFGELVAWLKPWVGAGVDGVFNYFIQRISSLHDSLYEVIRGVCLEGTKPQEWFYKGLTYLMPKGEAKRGSDFRPITCMSCLYKLTTKCVTEVVRIEVERRGLIAENQLGTVRGVQGSKEQALLNIAANKAHGNKLLELWVDVKKAFDSVNHSYLLACIKRLSLPVWVQAFLETTIASWTLQVRSNFEVILEKQVERGILQGDTLSPLLFALCMDPLSRSLNGAFPMIAIDSGEGRTHSINHLLFMDDLKLFATSEDNLAKLADEMRAFFQAIGLEMNREKSATNSAVCEGFAELLEGAAGYKYLGIIEDKTGVPKRECFEKVRAELLARVERLCKTRLNARHLFHAINEHALSLTNYYVGVLRLEPRDFEELDHAVRQCLSRHGLHAQPACKERLYLPRAQLGRGLHCLAFRSELMLTQLSSTLQASFEASTRRAAIWTSRPKPRPICP